MASGHGLSWQPTEDRSSSPPSTTIQLSLKCTKLINLDTFSKSDPVCVVFILQNKKWIEGGRTEILKDTQDPIWAHKVQLQYKLETKQVIMLEIYDTDSCKKSLDPDNFLGRVETTLENVVKSPRKQFTSMLQGGPKHEGSTLIVDVEEVSRNNDAVQIQFSALKLDKKDTFGKSDPFYIISKGMSSGQFVIVHRSEVVKRSLNPTWRPVKLPIRDLCNSDHEKQLKIDVYDEDNDGSHDLIGSFTTDLNILKLSATQGAKYPLINPKKEAKKKKKYIDSGNMLVKCCEIIN